MVKRSAITALSVMILSALLTPAAQAQEAATPITLASHSADGIMWFEATVETSNVDTLAIRILAPASGAASNRSGAVDREVFQICKFNFSGPGVYRCGIDVAPGAIAYDREGAWVSKVKVGRTVVAKMRFSL